MGTLKDYYNEQYYAMFGEDFPFMEAKQDQEEAFQQLKECVEKKKRLEELYPREHGALY